jgi:hypothetical protein
MRSNIFHEIRDRLSSVPTPLPRCPFEMFDQTGIFPERFAIGEALGQGHFIVVSVDAVMAQPARVDTPVQLVPAEVLLEINPAVELFGNQVMKGETAYPAA